MEPEVIQVVLIGRFTINSERTRTPVLFAVILRQRPLHRVRGSNGGFDASGNEHFGRRR